MRQINPGMSDVAAFLRWFEAKELKASRKKKIQNKFKTGWRRSYKRTPSAVVTPNSVLFETVEQYLSRGGKITKVPYADVI